LAIFIVFPFSLIILIAGASRMMLARIQIGFQLILEMLILRRVIKTPDHNSFHFLETLFERVLEARANQLGGNFLSLLAMIWPATGTFESSRTFQHIVKRLFVGIHCSTFLVVYS